MVDSLVKQFEAVISKINPDQLHLVLLMVSIIPFAFLFHLIKNPKLRMLYSFFPCLYFQFNIYKEDVIFAFISTIICYLLTKYTNRNKQPFYVLGYSLIHGSLYHLRNMMSTYGTWKMNITFIYMMMTLKYTSLAFNYKDGGCDESTLTENKKKYKVNDFSILEYFSYIYFFPCAVLSPVFEFKDFKNFINLEAQYNKLSFKSSLTACFKKIRYALFFLVIFIIFKDHSNPRVFYDDKFKDVSFLYKIFVSHMGIMVKYKYYVGFFMNEAMVVASGLSFDGENFDLIKHINHYETEKTKNARIFFKNWNLSVHIWLKRYIFERLIVVFTNPQTKKVNTLYPKIFTFMIAAFWHGFYPNYYIVFLHFYLSIEMCEGFLKFRNPFIKNIVNHWISEAIGWYIFFIGMNYYFYILSLLDYKDTLGYLIGTRFFITIICLSGFLFTKIGLMVEKSLSKEDKLEKKTN